MASDQPTRPGMGLGVRRATEADLDEVTEVITTSFDEDPVWSWAFPDPDRRREQYSIWWRFFVEGALPHGWVWVTGACEAASVWIPPGAPELTSEQEERLEPLMTELVGERAGEVLEALDRFEAAHPTGEPHYYLSLVGTHPAHRGYGIGVALLDDNLAHIDAAGMSAYLESSNPANLARYQRLGFSVCGSFDLPAGGPTVTTMWREPRAENL